MGVFNVNRKAIYTVLMLFAALTLLLTSLVGCKKNRPPEITKDITISGKVIWGGTENAVANATVKVGSTSTTTAANGTFQLKVTIPTAGLTGSLTVTHSQCVPFSQSISAAANLTVSDIFVTRLNHVDGTAGNDAIADGTVDKPYKTITAALAVDGWVTAQLAAGVYQFGETFPLILGENDTISGDLTTDTAIKTELDAIRVLDHGAKISAIIFWEQNLKQSHTAIQLGPSGTPASLTVDGCTFAGWSLAIDAGTKANLDIRDSGISNCIAAICFNGTAGMHLTLHSSMISNNTTGVAVYNSAAIDLGTSAVPGENNFHSNIFTMLYDCRPANSGAIYAVGNTWNYAFMPAVADKNTFGGIDFFIVNSGNTIIFSEE